MMKRSYAVAALAMVLISGCFSRGAMRRELLVMPDGEKATFVMHEQWAPDWALDRDSLEFNFLVKGEVTQTQLAAVAAVEDSCRVFVNTVHAPKLVSVISSGVLYGLAGFVGVGAGSQALPGDASFLAYGAYGAAATGVAGLANGIVSLAGETYTFDNCGREALVLFERYRNIRVLMKSPQY